MKKILNIGVYISAIVLLSMASCSDRDDYNTAPELQDGANVTLWEKISSTSNLQQFSQLLKKVGYDQILTTATVQTIWAPVDGSYDAAELLNSDSAEVLNHFVKNHISFYSHTLKAGESERITTLNNKSFEFSEQQFGEQPVQEMNIPCSNGFLHTINGKQHFYPNIYEYISSSEGIDSVKNYFKRFEETYLDEKNSVLGPVVGGRQTYIDSVMVTTNSLFSRFRAYIHREDSNYMALLPTNDAWNTAYKRMASYFTYATKTISQSLELPDVSSKPQTKTKTIDAAEYKDSLSRYSIMSNIFFNANDYYNQWAVGNPEAQTSDTLLSTRSTYLINGPEILSRSIYNETMSNGVIHILDSLAFLPSVWSPRIMVSAISSTYRPRTASCNPTSVWMDIEDMDITKIQEGQDTIMHYLDMVPTGKYVYPTVSFFLPNILSTTYEIFAVIFPADIEKDFEGDIKPNKFQAILNYSDAKGTLKSKTLGKTFENDPTKVDYVSLGKFTFPVAYRGLGEYYPDLEIKSTVKPTSSELKKYDTEIRIAAIILNPVN